MVLRSAGFPVGKLLLWNFIASLTCLGGVGNPSETTLALSPAVAMLLLCWRNRVVLVAVDAGGSGRVGFVIISESRLNC